MVIEVVHVNTDIERLVYDTIELSYESFESGGSTINVLHVLNSLQKFHIIHYFLVSIFKAIWAM